MEQSSFTYPTIQPEERDEQDEQDRGESDNDSPESVYWSSDEDGSNAGIAMGVHYPGATIRRDGEPTWPLALFRRRDRDHWHFE